MSEFAPSPDNISINHQKEIKKPTENIESILNTELTVENINTYADDAFTKLVDFSQQKVIDYKKSNLTNGLSDKEVEDTAFKYYGIKEINSILDHIAKKSEEINSLNNLVAKINKVIIKPDYSDKIITRGSGNFKEKIIVDRVKTVLFILKEDFDIDINNDQQLTIEKGIVDQKMTRKTSYYLVNAHTIDRTILVCDEEGNASYVFNSNILDQKEITNANLINYTKSELNDLIKESPEIGRRVIYDKERFVQRIKDSINNPISNFPDEAKSNSKNSANYLYPKNPEGYLSITGIYKKYNTSPKIINKIIDTIDNFGEVGKYRLLSGVLGFSFSPDQQEKIIEGLKNEGRLKSENLENYIPVYKFSAENHISSQTIDTIIKDNKSLVGEIIKDRFDRDMPVNALSPFQQKIILDLLEEKGMLNKPAPEGYLSARGIADKHHVGRYKVKAAIESVIEDIGEIHKFKVGTVSTFVFSPEQQILIEKQLKK